LDSDAVKGCLNVIYILKYVLMGILDVKIANSIEVSMKSRGVVHCWAFILMCILQYLEVEYAHSLLHHPHQKWYWMDPHTNILCLFSKPKQMGQERGPV
jgi:hypothetical protein